MIIKCFFFSGKGGVSLLCTRSKIFCIFTDFLSGHADFCPQIILIYPCLIGGIQFHWNANLVFTAVMFM